MLRVLRLHIAFQKLGILLLAEPLPGKMCILQHQRKLLTYQIIVRLSLNR